ncbi:STAS domain-containing protein [Symbioplanes lichenis]|uniref:STAS domain-containing protein n=1 Tax=Symbioplanes lichenis TaxID=1629072 RepID=UPI002738962F|nr:STAS domain-containing protein [Actinoplanes lichenis]
MNITVHQDPSGAIRLHLAGDLDLGTAELLGGEVRAALAEFRPETLVVDAGELGFCDSAGIHALLSARRDAHRGGSGFQVTNLHGRSLRALEVTGVLAGLTTLSRP